MESFIALNKLISTPNGIISSRVQIIENATEFIKYYEKSDSVVGEKHVAEEMRPIFSSLKSTNISIELELLFATILKILFRKQVNRDTIGKFGFSTLASCLARQSINSPAAAELGNTVLNACFDSNNVLLYLGEGGLAPLLRLLRASDTAVQASVLGALQGICFTAGGKYSIRSNLEAISQIAMLLISDEIIVRARAVGNVLFTVYSLMIYDL